MKFDMVTIKNFRNFENISVALTNKNVLFGMNDVGKTNFLYALRFVFDKDIRRQNFNDTDYYKKHIGSPIEIIVTIDISDQGDSDSQKLRAKLKGALLSGQNKVYIKVAASYDEKEMVATVYKGNIIKNLIMDCQSYTKYRPNETTGGIFVSWRRKEELPTGA